MMIDEDASPIIMDIGSGHLKAGLAEDDAPKHYIPMICGVPKSPDIMAGMDQKDAYYGDEAINKRQYLNLTYPVEAGVVMDFPMLEQILADEVFNNALKVQPSEHKIMMTEPPNNPKINREKMVEMMFTTFEVQKLYIGNQSVLSLFATGRTTGTVLDCGEGITHATPIYEGYAIPFAIQTIPLAGKDLTDYLQSLLNEKHSTLISGSTADRDQVKIMKEKMCYVTQDFDAELKQAVEHSTIEKKYPLPGDNMLTLKEERIKCPELMFNPHLNGKSEDGIHKYLHDCIIKCDNDIRKDLFKNIVLAGGSTMFYGMKDRMKKEIQALAPSTMGPEVEAPADRKYSCWLGGAILSQIDKFENMWITKKEFDDAGAKIVHRKCF